MTGQSAPTESAKRSWADFIQAVGEGYRAAIVLVDSGLEGTGGQSGGIRLCSQHTCESPIRQGNYIIAFFTASCVLTGIDLPTRKTQYTEPVVDPHSLGK